MRTGRPRRLSGVSYIGFQRYFVTACTSFRRPLFTEDAVVGMACEHLLHAAGLFEVAIPAYCFMPDHVHVVVTAESERSDLLGLMKYFKQTTGYAYSRSRGGPLWQPGYHERVLRDDEATESVVRYVLENPVRAGLAKAAGEYPHAGSFVYRIEDLLSNWRT
jgi:putative transposase